MYILRTVPHYRLHIKIQEKSGAGGGNRTIRAYSFYVTYCKHTNARTAQPAVCPTPMYKIMYNNSKAECVVGLLTPGCAPPLPVYRTASGSFPTATFQQVDATRVGPAAFRGVHTLNFQASYALSRFENSGGSNGNGPSSALASAQDYGGPRPRQC